jgi:hypothetical protein
MGWNVDAETLALRFVAAHTFGVVAHVRVLLHRHDVDARAVLDRLQDDGMIRETARLREHQAFAVTAAGLKRLDSKLELPRPDPRRYWDDFAAAYLWVAAHLGLFGENITAVYSRREMRLADQTTPPPDPATLAALSPTIRAKLTDTRFAVDLVGNDPRAHYPDVVLITAEGRTAFEVQLVASGRARLDAVLGGYADEPAVAAIIFLIEDPSIEPAIRHAADRAHVGDRVYVTPMKLDRRDPWGPVLR